MLRNILKLVAFTLLAIVLSVGVSSLVYLISPSLSSSAALLTGTLFGTWAGLAAYNE
ncbi:hypothetical protein ITP52_17430 [Bacillus subtilis]|uniref:hypothetical protein n=1 Tax=Bacillus subtilis TaxID=1423 RepID=UPI0018A7C973|nr:hypothetical protein [Bacillus subtilis]QPG30433.1 hypothetical protein ITP52_17430 [Bacillus subtilis]